MTTLRCTIAIIALAILPTPVFAVEPIHVGNFSGGDISGWSDQPFKGKTVYTLVREGERSVLKARSEKSSSGLIKKVKFDPKQYPLIRWSWKVDNLIKKEDVARKEGDDFSARVYVVFPRSFWRTRAINYVWSSAMPLGSHAPSPYTSNSMIIAVESGKTKVGRWITEERNIVEDYRKLFGEDPPQAGGVAIMTDTDDTREEATAYYGDIYLLPAKKEGSGGKVAPPPSGKTEQKHPAPAPPAPLQEPAKRQNDTGPTRKTGPAAPSASPASPAPPQPPGGLPVSHPAPGPSPGQ